MSGEREPDTWKPDQYHRFRDERSRPFHDLLALVQSRPGGLGRVIDLGCGTGELTRTLHESTGAHETVGVDSSAAMLEKAGSETRPGLRFVQGDIGKLGDAESGPFDLVFSNAALQWVPDHAFLLPRLRALLAPGGQLAAQVPANHDHPSHVVAHEIAREAPFAEALKGYVRSKPVLEPEAYATLLERLGFARQEVVLRIYGHHLASREEVIEWVKGTLLTDYERRLTPDLWRRFLDRYRERLLPRLDDTRPFFYPFKRTLFWAALPAPTTE
jgi:trans-aconitate 2-methyltransferase